MLDGLSLSLLRIWLRLASNGMNGDGASLLLQGLAPSLAHCSVATDADHRGNAAPAQVARLADWLTAAGADLAAVEIRASEVATPAHVPP